MIITLRRILLREKESFRRYEKQNSKVCMVVWNTFVTDARVTKEAKTLIRSGKQVTVIAVHEPGKTLKTETKDGIRIIRVSRPSLKSKSRNEIVGSQRRLSQSQQSSNRPSKRNVKNILKSIVKLSVKWVINLKFLYYAFRENAGIYHAHDLNTLIPLFFVSRLRGTRLIYDAHEVSTDRAGWKYKRLWRFIEKILIRKADEVITTNQTRAEYFKSTYNIPIPKLIHNVPEHQQIKESNVLREILQIPDGTPILLYQGGIQRERGLETLIRSMSLLPHAVLVLIGDGSLKDKLINLTEELCLEHRVMFMNTVPMEKLLQYTASADIGMQVLQNTCFNHYSACSNKLFEYIMAGIPVVTSDLPEMRKVVESTGTGLLIDPTEPVNIAEAVKRMLEDQELYQMCKQNTRKAAQKYNWEREERTLIGIYS